MKYTLFKILYLAIFIKIYNPIISNFLFYIDEYKTMKK